MDGIVPELNVNVRRAPEDYIIHLMRLIRASPNASEWIVNRDIIRVSEILVNHL
jgi:hypothetical protein